MKTSVHQHNIHTFAGKQKIMATEKKRTINTFEILLLGTAVLILVSIGLQKCGVKVVNQKEDTQIIHKPHQ